MTSLLLRLRHRFISELPLWHLRNWQTLVLLLLSVWPWLIQGLFPGHGTLSLVPVVVFLPVGYLVGGLFMALLPKVSWAYQLGVSVTIFGLSYLVIVSWRVRHAKSP